MKSHALLLSLSVVTSVFALANCTAGNEFLFFPVHDTDDGGVGGGGGSSSGSGGQVSTSSSSSSSSSGISSSSSSSSGSSSSSSSSSSGSSSSSSSSGAGGGSPIDCAAIPKGPFPYTVKYGQKASEDMDFDDAGNLVGAEGGNIFKSTFSGQSQIWIPGSGDFLAGMRFASNGILVYANVTSNTLFKVEPPSNKAPLVGGLSYPNGMDADNNGRIAVAEQNSSQLRRVDAKTGAFEILATGLNNANGVSYSPDYKTIYVGSFGGNIIYKVNLDANDNPISQGVFIQNFTQNGTLDGMGVDACGNVYVCEYIAAKVWRIPPTGVGPELIVDLSAETNWIPNMQWGSGIGGWDPLVLYVRDISSGKMYEVPVGVPTKPRKYP